MDKVLNSKKFPDSDVQLELNARDNGVFLLFILHADGNKYAEYELTDVDAATELYQEIVNYISKHECYECAAETFRLERVTFYFDTGPITTWYEGGVSAHAVRD